MSERWKPNVTVAALIGKVVDGEHRFLLVEEHTAEGLRLNNPAGHLNPGESLLQGVAREVLEETGCVFVPTQLVGAYLSRVYRQGTGEDITYLRFAFTGTASAPQPGWVLDEGIVRTLWMSPAEIRANAHRHRNPLLMRGIEDYLSGKRYPLDLLTTDPSVFAPQIKA
ncbi:NUDIX hydrolase [uncultured Azohydromonas sp.]|jgi:NTP pyrophosphohydrolases including oxidative damage repair enzymes|uniref:NUDIX hydrolase n=1 Tax=uncultured Azohydromonas sp. TaxID=487342 RepID=UPI00260E3824|nr:NUDIX hydrolase [uncultured Azohydromonas sp.]